MKRAFTLVELIVVITILAILGMIAFISLQNYTREARDSKRIQDVRSLITKLNVENIKGTPYADMLTDKNYYYKMIGGVDMPVVSGIVDFEYLRENRENFLDPEYKIDYDFATAIGEAKFEGIEQSYNFIEGRYWSERDNSVVILGNYSRYDESDAEHLFSGSINITVGYCNDSTKPTDNGNIIFTEGEPSKQNQTWEYGQENCGYKCKKDYSGLDCSEYTPSPIVYMPFDAVYESQLYLKDNISNEKFSITAGSILHSTTQAKIGAGSIYFSGTNDNRLTKAMSSLNFGTGDFTVSVWLYPETQIGAYPVIFGNESNNVSTTGLIFIFADGAASSNITLTNQNTRILNTGKKYTPDDWIHYALVRKDGVFTIYENGISIGSTSSYTANSVNMSDFSIGGVGTNTGNHTAYKGYMDDFAIYDYAKWDSNFTPPTTAQTDANILHLEFEDDQEQVIDELLSEKISDSPFSVTSGLPAGRSTTKKFGIASLYFGGTLDNRLTKTIPSLNFGTSDFTVSVRLYPETQITDYPIVFGNQSNNTLPEGLVFHLADTVAGKNIALTNLNARILNTGKKYTPNEWVHYALVRKDGVFTIYENGINIGSTSSYTANSVNISDFSIGGIGINSANNSAYKGYMDDFAIYDYAKRDTNFTPPDTPSM